MTESLPRTTRLLHAGSAAEVAEAAALLRAGGLVAVPTETVYGLAADARQPEAVRGIFVAKQRPGSHPLIVHLGSAAALPAWASDIPEKAWQLAAAFWPGPLTLLLKKAPGVSDIITGGLPTIGLRVPAHPVLLALLAEPGSGLAAPSANLHKQLSPTSAAQVLASLDGRIDAVLDGGTCALGLESTILDLCSDHPRILRAGPISRASIEAVLGEAVEVPAQHSTSVPGNISVHYRPATPLYRLDAGQLAGVLQRAPSGLRLGVISCGELALPITPVLHTHLSLSADAAAYAGRLYDTLYTLDRLQLDAILLQAPPTDEAWLAVNDRLQRAALGQVPDWS